MTLPRTITSPRRFLDSPPAGFDGVFDWSWTEGCFDARDKIKPMDVDAIVERCGQFLVFETKEPGREMPAGQRYTLERLHSLGCFTILLIFGKARPETAEVWYPGIRRRQEIVGVESIRALVARWYRWADNGGRPRR